MSTLTIEKVNNIEIKNYGESGVRNPVKGREVVGDSETNRIAIIGQGGQGKTVLASNIIRMIAGKHTIIFWFSPTATIDPVVKKISKELSCEFEFYRGTIVDGVDLLNESAEQFDEEPFLDSKKRRVPKGICVLDDSPCNLKSENINEAFKRFRHFRCCIICCFHDTIDLMKGVRQEITICCMFGGMAMERFKNFMKDWGVPNLDIDAAWYCYNKLLKKTDFLTIYKRTGEMRLNFDKIIEIE